MATKPAKWVAMALSVAIVACANNDEAPLEPRVVTRVFVSPSVRDLMVGDTARLSADLVAADGSTRSGRLTQWRSDQPFVASVDSIGLVTGVASGTTLVHATIEGKTGAATVRVSSQQGLARPSISQLIPTSVATGSGDFTLIVRGSGFSSGARIAWDGTLRLTSYVSSSELRAQIGQADVALPSRVRITVVNDGNDRAVSNARDFTVVTSRNRR